MAVGRLHIFEIGRDKGRHGDIIREYQVNYNDAGNTFSGIMPEEKLRDFLLSKAALNPEALDCSFAELHSSGRTTVAGVELGENDAAAIGLLQEPSDT